MCPWIMGSLVKESDEQVTLVLVIRERRHKNDVGDVGAEKKETEFHWIARRPAKFIDQLVHDRVTLRCDSKIRSRRWQGQLHKLAKKEDCDRKTTGGRELVHRNHRTHGGTRGWPGQNTQSCIGAKVPPDARILCWLVEFAA